MPGGSGLPENDTDEAPRADGESAAGESGPVKRDVARLHWSALWKDAKAPVIVVTLTVVMSFASLLVSIFSLHDASSQYDGSQEQALLSIVVSISQEKQDSLQSDLRTLADAQEADMIIEQLPQGAVPSVEKYQVGMALETGYDSQPALVLLQEAATEASDPVAAADSWRGAADVLYKLNRYKEAEYDIARARAAINARNATVPAAEDNIAYTDFFDITLRTSIRPVSLADCKAAASDWSEAERTMGQYPYAIPGALEAEQELAVSAANKYCHALLPDPPG